MCSRVCESVRLGELQAPNLVDEAANLGAAAWCVLPDHSVSPLSEAAIAEEYSRRRSSTQGGWRTHAQPLAEWRRQLRNHAAAVLLARALGTFEPEETFVPSLVSLIGLAEGGAQWINQTGLRGDELR